MESLVRSRVAGFIAFLIVLTAAVTFAGPGTEGSGLRSLLIMWSPGLAAIAASLLTRRSFGQIGWRLGPVRWLVAGWLIPIVYAAPAYALVWVTGLGAVPSSTFLERARLTLGMPTEGNGMVIAAAFGYITVVNLLPSMVLALGEEIGWRGFLVPELAKSGGFRKAAVWSGLIWGGWHLPGVLSGAYGAASTPLAFRVACFLSLVVTTAVIMAWLRMKSGSIWPVAIMHATHNGVIQAFFDRITADTGPTPYFTGEFGIAMIPFVMGVAWVVWRRSGEIVVLAEEGVAAEPPRVDPHEQLTSVL